MTNRCFLGAITAFSLALGLFSPSLSAQELLKTEQSITLDAALKVAEIALKESRANGATNIAVVVVDKAARTLVALRDDKAPEHPLLAARRKAWTAANYGSATKDVLERIRKGAGDDSELVYTENSLFLMGGVPLRSGDSLVGAIGVSGNPSGDEDNEVASKAAAAFAEMLKKN